MFARMRHESQKSEQSKNQSDHEPHDPWRVSSIINQNERIV